MAEVNDQPDPTAEMLRRAVASIPEPGGGSLPYVLATTPARLTMQMLKTVLTSVVNLSEAGHGKGSVNPLDVLNVMAPEALVSPKDAVGVFGARLPTEGRILSQGVRGHVYHETNDSSAVLHPERLPAPGYNTGTTLQQVLNHPELYRLYPELKDIPVNTFHGAAGDHGYYYGGKDDDYGINININDPADLQKTTILHETQHAVQRVDNQDAQNMRQVSLYGLPDRPQGTSPGVAGADATRLRNILQSIKPEFLKDDEFANLARLNEAVIQNRSLFQKQGVGNQYAYLHNPGEIEAFQTTDRMGMSSYERQKAPPVWAGPTGQKPLDTELELQKLGQDPSVTDQASDDRSGPYVPASNEDIPGVRGQSLIDAASPLTAKQFEDYIQQTGLPKTARSVVDESGILDMSSITRQAEAAVHAKEPNPGGMSNDDFFKSLGLK